MTTIIRAPGRTVSIGEAVRRINPHLFESLDREAKKLLNSEPLAPKKRIRQRTKPLSNKLESEFGAHLQKLWPTWKLFEQALTFRIGNGVRFTPDWIAMEPGNVYCYEVKGPRLWDDAVVKLKVAASTYRQFHWFMAWKDNGYWQTQAIEP